MSEELTHNNLQKIAPFVINAHIFFSVNNPHFYRDCQTWCEETIGKDFWPAGSSKIPKNLSGRAWTWYNHPNSNSIDFYFTNVEDAIHFKMRWC
jgi:hypothetical protein